MKNKKLPASIKKKTARENRDVVYVVVWVTSGVTDTVEVYRDDKTARARESELQEKADENDDMVAVFETEIGTPLKD